MNLSADFPCSEVLLVKIGALVGYDGWCVDLKGWKQDKEKGEDHEGTDEEGNDNATDDGVTALGLEEGFGLGGELGMQAHEMDGWTAFGFSREIGQRPLLVRKTPAGLCKAQRAGKWDLRKFEIWDP